MSQDYKKYLLAKNKAQEKNLNSYRTQYETAIGKIKLHLKKRKSN